MTTPRNPERNDRYYGGGRGGYTGGADGRGDRYHGGGRGGYTSGGAGGHDSKDDGGRDHAAPLQEDWRRRR